MLRDKVSIFFAEKIGIAYMDEYNDNANDGVPLSRLPAALIDRSMDMPGEKRQVWQVPPARPVKALSTTSELAAKSTSRLRINHFLLMKRQRNVFSVVSARLYAH
jgi:hypothetical protein